MLLLAFFFSNAVLLLIKSTSILGSLRLIYFWLVGVACIISANERMVQQNSYITESQLSCLTRQSGCFCTSQKK